MSRKETKGQNEKGKHQRPFSARTQTESRRNLGFVRGRQVGVGLSRFRILAVGTPGMALDSRKNGCRCFTGVHVSEMPDSDRQSIGNAVENGKRLKAVAASVRIGILPQEITDTAGPTAGTCCETSATVARMRFAVRSTKP